MAHPLRYTNPKSISVSAMTSSGANTVVSIDSYPDKCPICDIPSLPIYRYSFRSNHDSLNHILQAVFECPRTPCGCLYNAIYVQSNHHLGDFTYYLKNSILLTYNKDIKFPDTIVKISPDFVKIYNQAAQADENKLALICGAGYRKSLEFLVKDYLISGDASISEVVKAEMLGDALKRIDDIRIKALATKASWIGNDETHYERRLKSADLQDLITLISLVVNWIDSSELSKKYMES